MAEHTIQIAEEIYQLLRERTQQFQTTPEAVLTQLAREWLLLTADQPADELALLEEPATPEAALAAVQRLTHLFADVTIPNFDQVVADPALAMENIPFLDTEHA